MSAVDIKSSEFSDEVLKSSKYVLVDFWAPWCMPCRIMGPILDEISEDSEFKNNLKVIKINIDEPENRDLAIRYEVRGIPNMKLFKDGEVVEDFVGMRSKEVLLDELISVIE